MRRPRRALLALLPTLLAGCGLFANSTPSPPAHDPLAAMSAQDLAADAQTFLNQGNYTFSGSGTQLTRSTGLKGVSPGFSVLANTAGSWISAGAVAGPDKISAYGDFRPGGKIYEILDGCNGFTSVDGSAWAGGAGGEGELAHSLAPILGNVTSNALTWHDQGLAYRSGTWTHHLHAAITTHALSGLSVSGFTVAASSIDIWVRIGDESVAQVAEHLDLTIDFNTLRSPSAPNAAGTMHSVLDMSIAVAPASALVSAPLSP